MQKIIISASLLVSLLLGVQMSFAQNLTDGDPSNDVCVNLQTSVFRYKSSDMTTNGEVSDLQDFLIAKGMLSGTPTGFYGRLTVAAVKTYQRSLGISPTGNVGSLTKSLIQKETCTRESQPITDPVVISPIPGMKTITYYYINDAHTACGRGTLITNIGLVNGEYIYKPGQYKTESECKTTNGLPSIPTGIMCTMEVKLCPDGSAMQRDPNCSWRSDKCAVSTIQSRPSITNVVTSLSGDILTATIYGYNLEKVNNVSEERKVDGTRYITPSSVDYGKVTVVLSTRGAYNGISTFKVYSQNGAVESNMMSITLPEVSSNTSIKTTSPEITQVSVSKLDSKYGYTEDYYGNLNPAAQMILKGNRLDTVSKMIVGNGCTTIDLNDSGVQQFIVKSPASLTIYNPIEFINNNTNFDYGRGKNPLNCVNFEGTTYIELTAFDGKRSNLAQAQIPSLPDPVISSFVMNDSQQFSLAARNYSTLTFKADCGNFVAVVNSTDGTSRYPQGNNSLCNAEQYYHVSKTNSIDFAPVIYNQRLSLWENGVLEGSTTYIGNGATQNNNGTVIITVKACNTLGKCSQASVPVKIFAKG